MHEKSACRFPSGQILMENSEWPMIRFSWFDVTHGPNIAFRSVLFLPWETSFVDY